MYPLRAVMLVGAFAGAIGVIGCLCVVYLWRLVDKSINARCEMQSRIEALQAELDEMRNGAKRHTHNTMAGIEDALAIAIDVLGEYASSRRYTEARIAQLQAILQQLRESPYAYDPERHAGVRPLRRHEQ